jgi:hypothetical protein
MKTPYIALLISLSALLFWQCYEVLYQDTKFLMHEILMKNQPLFSGDDTSTMHDKKYGYFLQITDTHVSRPAVLCDQTLILFVLLLAG